MGARNRTGRAEQGKKMREITWETPNKMHIDSDFATFNKQTNLISAGNVIANTQYSNYIRPYDMTENFGNHFERGALCKYDMQYFKYIPDSMRKRLLDINRRENYILYEFCVYRNRGKEIIGYVLTDALHRFIEDSVYCEYGCSYWKRRSAINACKEYICE